MTPEQVAILNETIRARWANENTFMKNKLAVIQQGKVEEGKRYNIVNQGFENRPGYTTSTQAESNIGTLVQKQSDMANSHIFDILRVTPEEILEGNKLNKAFFELGQSATTASNQNLDGRMISMIKGITNKLKDENQDYQKILRTGLKIEHLIDIDYQAKDRIDFLQGAIYLMNSMTHLSIVKDKFINEKFVRSRGIQTSDKVTITDRTISGTAYKVHPIYLVRPRTIEIRGGSPEVNSFDDSNSADFKKGYKYKTLSSIGILAANWKGTVSSASTTDLEDKSKWDFNELIEKKDYGVYLMEFLISA